MALGDASSPVRFGKGATSGGSLDNRSLFLDVFGGEVLTAIDNCYPDARQTYCQIRSRWGKIFPLS